MPVFMHCCLCDRKSVDGFLSRYAWEHLTANPHRVLQVCPGCREQYPDWESRARATVVQVAEQQGPRSYETA